MYLNKEQEQTVCLMHHGYNVFITGGAGTGKSTVIKEYVNRYCADKNVVLAAPTGVAAHHIDGYTMHRVFGVPVGNLIGKEPMDSTEQLDDTDVLIIDEISMARIDLFEYCMKVLKIANHNRASAGKKPIQLIVSGDFFQLPPVAGSTDKIQLQNCYCDLLDDGYFAFESDQWKQMDFKNAVLTQSVRQKNNLFTECLNHIRTGDQYSRDAIEMIIQNSAKHPFENAVTVASTNAKVNSINEDRLECLNTESTVYSPVVTGAVSEKELADTPTLRLYRDERVMLTANSTCYANGSFGTIIDMDEDELQVKLDNGNVVSVTRKMRYFLNEELIPFDQVNSIAQFPLQPAYAVTYHKVQGLTLPYMNLDPYCFTAGQLYVGLSRVPDFNYLYIDGRIRNRDLIVSPAVSLFYEFMENDSSKYMPIRNSTMIQMNHPIDYGEALYF